MGSGFILGKWHQFECLCAVVWSLCGLLLNSLPLPFTSTNNKQPEPAPRRSSTVNKKQPQLTSPTFQPPLPPLEVWGGGQPEPQAAEAELGVGAAANAGVSVGGGLHTVVQPQVVQFSSEESR